MNDIIFQNNHNIIPVAVAIDGIFSEAPIIVLWFQVSIENFCSESFNWTKRNCTDVL